MIYLVKKLISLEDRLPVAMMGAGDGLPSVRSSILSICLTAIAITLPVFPHCPLDWLYDMLPIPHG